MRNPYRYTKAELKVLPYVNAGLTIGEIAFKIKSDSYRKQIESAREKLRLNMALDRDHETVNFPLKKARGYVCLKAK